MTKILQICTIISDADATRWKEFKPENNLKYRGLFVNLNQAYLILMWQIATVIYSYYWLKSN